MKPWFYISPMANSPPTLQINLKLFYNDFPQKYIGCHNHWFHIPNITLYTFQRRPYVAPRHKEIGVGTPPNHYCSVLYLFGICQAPYLPYNSQSSPSLSTLLVVWDKGAKGKTLYTLITNLDSLLRGEVSTQAVNPDDYLGIQVRTPCKPCCIVRYLIYILLYVLARFAIWINEWIKIIMIQFII